MAMAARYLAHFALLATTLGAKDEAAAWALGPGRGDQEVLDATSFLQLVAESGAALDASAAEEVAPVEEIAKAEIDLLKERGEQETEILKEIVEMKEHEARGKGREPAAGREEGGAGSGPAIEMAGREVAKEEEETRGAATKGTQAVAHVLDRRATDAPVLHRAGGQNKPPATRPRTSEGSSTARARAKEGRAPASEAARRAGGGRRGRRQQDEPAPEGQAAETASGAPASGEEETRNATTNGTQAVANVLDQRAPRWELIYRQMPGSYRPVKDWLLVNETDQTIGDFSVLEYLEDYRGADGTFHLKLAWPGTTLQEQEWKQTSNPITRNASGVEGYEAVSAPYNQNHWGGLEYNGGSTGPVLLDGSVDHVHWYYAVGASRPYNGGIAGPYGFQNSVELYAWVEHELPDHSGQGGQSGQDGQSGQGDQSSVVGDPHVVNVAHARFEIRAAGVHKLVQVPRLMQASSKPDLRVDAKIEHLVGNDCSKSFMTSLSIFGRWTEDAFGLIRISQGSDMPNTTLLINTLPPEEFFAQSPLPGAEAGHASADFKVRDVSFHVGKKFEGRYGKQQAYLNVRITGLKKHSDLGGLLGYDDHADAEKLDVNCVAAKPGAAYQSSLIGSERSAPIITDGGSRIEAE